MPDKKEAPDTIAGRVKESLGEIRKHFSGKGARVRQDRYDRAMDSAETGQRDPYVPDKVEKRDNNTTAGLGRSVSQYSHMARKENRGGTSRTRYG